VKVMMAGALLDPANIQLLCGSCHTLKTNAVKRARLGLPAIVEPPCVIGGGGMQSLWSLANNRPNAHAQKKYRAAQRPEPLCEV